MKYLEVNPQLNFRLVSGKLQVFIRDQHKEISSNLIGTIIDISAKKFIRTDYLDDKIILQLKKSAILIDSNPSRKSDLSYQDTNLKIIDILQLRGINLNNSPNQLRSTDEFIPPSKPLVDNTLALLLNRKSDRIYKPITPKVYDNYSRFVEFVQKVSILQDIDKVIELKFIKIGLFTKLPQNSGLRFIELSESGFSTKVLPHITFRMLLTKLGVVWDKDEMNAAENILGFSLSYFESNLLHKINPVKLEVAAGMAFSKLTEFMNSYSLGTCMLGTHNYDISNKILHEINSKSVETIYLMKFGSIETKQ